LAECDAHFARLLAASPVGSANGRVLRWDESGGLADVFRSGVNLVLFSYLAVDMYAIETYRQAHGLGLVADADASDIDTMDRLRDTLPSILSCGRPGGDLLARYGTIREVRDSIMHPKPTNLYASDESWDQVPLAWLLSERRAICLPTSKLIIEHFEPHRKSLLARLSTPVTLTVQRGQEYIHPAKKLP
jgi:hypothetical protein